VLAKLSTNTIDTQTAYNASVRDMLRLLCGEITTTAQLDATVWNVGSCGVTNVVAANWTRAWCSVDFDNLGATTDWDCYLTKTGAIAAKPITFRVRVSTSQLQIFAGIFNTTTGEAQSVTTAFASVSISLVNSVYVVSSAASGLLIYGAAYGQNLFGVERTTCPYDATTLESLGVVGSFSTGNHCYVAKIFNPSGGNYNAHTPVVHIVDGSVGTTRDSDGQVALPFVPLHVEHYENGWAGGSLSGNLSVYRTADNYGKFWDRTLQNGKTWRILTPDNSTTRFVVCEE